MARFFLLRLLVRPWLVAAALSLAGLAVAPTARAVEGEWHLGARLGVATLTGSSLGPAADVHGAYELNDMFDVVANVTGSRQGGASGTDVLSASAGLAYKIDVFEFIPYVSALGGYYRYSGLPGPNRGDRGDPGASLHVGLDYTPSRQLAFGADLGWHTMFHGLTFPQFTALVGAEYRFGW
ncbi:MAG TPA: outer membrane beta-barrel protein [Polyangiaceae bacterium]